MIIENARYKSTFKIMINIKFAFIIKIKMHILVHIDTYKKSSH